MQRVRKSQCSGKHVSFRVKDSGSDLSFAACLSIFSKFSIMTLLLL